MTTVFAANEVADSSVLYMFQVQALTPAADHTVSQTTQPEQSAFLPQLPGTWSLFASVGIFILLFIGAMGIQIIGKIKERANIVTMLGLALFFASIPFLLSTMQENTRTQTNAGPEEVPRDVQVIQTAPDTIRVTWRTDASRPGSIRIGVAPLQKDKAKVVIADSGRSVKEHSAVIDLISRGMPYEMEVLSGSFWYTNNGKPIRIQLVGR